MFLVSISLHSHRRFTQTFYFTHALYYFHFQCFVSTSGGLQSRRPQLLVGSSDIFLAARTLCFTFHLQLQKLRFTKMLNKTHPILPHKIILHSQNIIQIYYRYRFLLYMSTRIIFHIPRFIFHTFIIINICIIHRCIQF